jgi:DNA (cytosine-5)-methyltransferase 1
MLSEGTEARATSVVPGDLVPLEFKFENNQCQPRDPFESSPSMTGLTCLEICAGGGGQSLGLHQAGFAHVAAVEIDLDACETLRLNHKEWNIVERDIHHFGATNHKGVDLLAGGVPCPPFSIAGKQLGADDERDLFPCALRIIEECGPTAIMLENVRGLSTTRFASYREQVLARLRDELGYEVDWQVLNACDFGVPQLRPRFILVAMKAPVFKYFKWPDRIKNPPTVGTALYEYMAADGWQGAKVWAEKANGIGPTLVGGSRKHGGPDLGPTRARNDWLKLHVDGKGLANASPKATDPIDYLPRLTLPMAAAIQGFPPSWRFYGRKTAAYRQIGNAFPPPVARAVGESIRSAILRARGVPAVSLDRLLRVV